MVQIVCQYGPHRCLYIQQPLYSKLREHILVDFEGISPDFELMYIDEQAGDWMIVENQRDFDRILGVSPGHILMKVLPPIQRDEDIPCKSEGQVGKLQLTAELKNMVEYISLKHIEKYTARKMTEKMMQVSEIMLEEMMPPSRTHFMPINSDIQRRLAFERPSRRASRLSPSKHCDEKIEKAVRTKIENLMPSIIQSVYEQIQNSIMCRACMIKQLEMTKIMNKELLKKVRNTDNPQQ